MVAKQNVPTARQQKEPHVAMLRSFIFSQSCNAIKRQCEKKYLTFAFAHAINTYLTPKQQKSECRLTWYLLLNWGNPAYQGLLRAKPKLEPTTTPMGVCRNGRSDQELTEAELLSLLRLRQDTQTEGLLNGLSDRRLLLRMK
jgi:hypothetical protein